jgi:hypothetical protein
MKKLMIVLVLVGLGFSMVGCTVGETAMERHRRMMLTYDMQLRCAVEEADSWMLQERNCRSTMWPVRIGY